MHEKITTDNTPINIRPYRLPESQKAEIHDQVCKMEKDGIIQKSMSPYNAPLLIVPKKPSSNGEIKYRIVVDFRRLNDITVGQSFRIPRVEEILDQLGNAKYFSTLDLASGYHQIKVHPRDRHKTAFSTSTGHYEFYRLPFGLKTAPSTFQRLMNSVLAGINGIKCFVYLDDIVIYGSNLKQHNRKLQEVFDRLREFNLKLQLEKCSFLRKEVHYLGHVITQDGIKPDPTKIEAVDNFKIPKNERDIKSFLGLCGYYRKFIQNFSHIAKPLTELLKNGNEFKWILSQQEAFDILKNKLTTAPLLQYPCFDHHHFY